MNPPLYTTCPDCDGKMAIPHVQDLNEIIGCTPGCPTCGKLLFCAPPGELVVFDEHKHVSTRALPQG